MNTQLLCRPALLSVLGTAAAAALLTSVTSSPAAGAAAATGQIRDRPCTGGGADTCSGVSQQPWDFTRVFAQYTG